MEDWDEALEVGLRAVHTVLQGGSLDPEKDDSGAFLDSIWLVLVLVIICCVWGSCTEHCYDWDNEQDLDGFDEDEVLQEKYADYQSGKRLTERSYAYGPAGGPVLASYPDANGDVAADFEDYVSSSASGGSYQTF